MEEQTSAFDFSRTDDRVDKLIEDFGIKFQKMRRDMSFNQYGSFLCDPLNPPKPQKLVVSSVMDDMIAAVTYIPQPCRHLLMHVSTSPMVPLVSEDMPSAGFSKDKPTSQHCPQFALPWSILPPKFFSHITSTAPPDKIPEVAQDSKETQAKDTQTRHPLKPVSQSVSRTKIGEAADDSKGIKHNDITSVGSLKENVSVRQVSPIKRPRTMAKVAHVSNGTQAKARQSVGFLKENPIARQRSPTMEPQARHPLKPVSHNVSRPKTGKAADGSKGIKDNAIPSVDSLKENVSVRQVSPITQPRNMAKVAHISKGTQAKARQSVGFSKENPIARQRSPTMEPQARHPLKPHNVSRAKTDKVADDSKGIKGNRVLSVGSSKENVSAAILPKIKCPPMPSSYNRAPQNKLEKVATQGLQANHAPCGGSSKENPSAHNRSTTAVPQKRHPSKPSIHRISGVLDNKMAKIEHKPEGSQAKETLSMNFSKDNPSARVVSSTAKPQARHSLKLVPRDPKAIQDKDIPSEGSLKENVSAHQLSPTIRPRTKCPPKAPSFKRDTDNKLEKVPHQGIETNRIPSAGSLNENPALHLSTSSKGKDICQTSSGHSDFEFKASKTQKKSCVSLGNELSKDARLENENPKGRHSGVSEAPAPDTMATQNGNDEWVRCDTCNKWRLLPYGTNTAELPNKWKCKLQTWLPGLNKCSISEEDSKKAFLDLYPGPNFKDSSNLNGHHDIVASDIGKFQKADCATKKQKVRSWEESQASQHAGNKKFKSTDEASENRGISTPHNGRSEKVDCGSKKQKVRSWEESQFGQHAGNNKIIFTDESCESYLRKQKKVASSSPSKILKTDKHAGRRAVNEVDVSQKSSDDHVDCASVLCGIRKKTTSYLENRYLDTHKVVEQKKLDTFNSCCGKEEHLPSKYCSTITQEVDHKESENNQNRRRCGLRHPTSDVEDVQCPINKCDNSKAIEALKDATDLRDTAKRLEDEGLGAESTSLFFQSALKFLHAAFLAEPSDHHDMKYEEATESIRLYVEASRICKSCAIAFERCGKMAVAALAYKCLEVANFKMAFIQYPFTRKDQNELRATFQMVNPGDSPSSFDPGADCIKTPVWLDTSALTKDASSSQIADHLVITSPCLPIYTRWLENTSKTICAFEASVKAQNAFGAAIDRMGKEAKGLPLVKNVLDMNFHNLEELLRHVDLSVESIDWK